MTPAGLNPGDHFRFVFITDGTTTAASQNIGDYTSFVNSQANGATYNGQVIPWIPIASTPGVNAIDNIGQTPFPVYLADGTKVADSTTLTPPGGGGLWATTPGVGSPAILLHAINLDLAGNTTTSEFAWTGTDTNGQGAGASFPIDTGSNQLLGALVNSAVGLTSTTTARWVDTGASPPGNSEPLYGISGPLTVPGGVVPEPASLWLLGTAISVGLAYGWSRRRA